MTIITGLPWESLARTRKDEGIMVMSVNPALLRSSRSRWLIWVGAWALGAAFWSVADPAAGFVVAAAAEPTKPPARSSAHRVLPRALMGSVSYSRPAPLATAGAPARSDPRG